MATWTQADADKLRAAIVALATGSAVQRVRYDGPPAREVEYQPQSLPQMRQLLAEMETAVRLESGQATYTLAATRKGF